MLDELVVMADLARPPTEPRWRCPLPGCGLEVVHPEELEFHANLAHPDWEVRRVRRAAARGFRHHEPRVVYRRRYTAPAPADDEDEDLEDDPECE
jgi:hypothetical protein